MKPSFPPPAREALFLVVCALVWGAACTPNNSVKAGAPELIEFIIAQPAPPGGFPPFMTTTVKGDTPDCVNPIMSGDACLPMGKKADAADGGTVTVDIPPDGLCRDTAGMNWCNCVGGADPEVGTWSCEPFTNVAAVIAVFDRLLDTTPFDMVDAGPVNDVVTPSASPGAPAIELSTDYSSTGVGNGLVFNVYGPFFGNLRGDGPSLFSVPVPEFPSGATVTVSIQASKIHAKDGTTPFTGTGPLASGLLLFTMAPFSASLSPPNPMAYGYDPNAVVVAFTNFVDLADATPHITATVNGTAAPISVTTDNNAYLYVTPAGGDPWPTGATVVVNVDATVTNSLGQTIAAVPPLTFTAP